MTNELGTTLSDIEAKAERKREVFSCLYVLYSRTGRLWNKGDYETIRKYIEEN